MINAKVKPSGKYSYVDVDEAPTPIYHYRRGSFGSLPPVAQPANSDNEHTPIHGSGTYPVYRRAADEMSAKLEKLTGDTLFIGTARMLAAGLQWYAEEFAKWSPTNRPTELTRDQKITDFLKLYHHARSLCEKIN